jgi:hypothetical protein
LQIFHTDILKDSFSETGEKMFPYTKFLKSYQESHL